MEQSEKNLLNLHFNRAKNAVEREDYRLAGEEYHLVYKIAQRLAMQAKTIFDQEEYLSLAKEYLNKESYCQMMESKKEKPLSIKPSLSFHDLCGLEKAKAYLNDTVILPYKNKTLFQREKNGICIYGPEKCGKTTLVKALAHELGATIIPIQPLKNYDPNNFPDIQQYIQRLFDEAEKKEIAVLFFEDPLCFFPFSEKNTVLNDMKNLFVYLFKKEMKRVKKKKLNVLFVATTECPDKLSKDFYQEGMFDDLIRIDLPDHRTRESIIRQIIPSINEDVLKEIIYSTEGYHTWGVTEIAFDLLKQEEPIQIETVKKLLDQHPLQKDEEYQNHISEFENNAK